MVAAVNRLLIAVVSLVAEHRLWSTGSVVVAMLHRLSSPRHVTSSPTRDRTCVPWVGRQILIHCTTREDLKTFFFGCGPFLKSSLNFLKHCLCLMFCFLGQDASGISAP